MRWFVILIAASAVAAPSVAHGTSAARPQLRLVDTQPLTLRATGFKPHEHVRLTIAAATRAVRQANASAAGSFTMRLSGVDVNYCTGFAITAVGDEGSRATFKRAPGECPLP